MVVEAASGRGPRAPGDRQVKVALFGKSGQVATEFQRLCTPDRLDVIGRDRADFSDPDAVRAAARATECDTIVNAVAYTAVDKAEAEPDLARTVNTVSVAALAEVAAERNLPLVHISTDYVFPGAGTQAHQPDDPTGPLGVYGQTKLDGEVAIRASGARHVILRTSWVFSAHGANFAKTMLRLSETRDALDIVGDQIGGPTPAGDIAQALLKIGSAVRDGHAGGTYHFSGAPDVSWADFAREIFLQAGRKVTVRDIPTKDYPTPARRPLNSRLDCSATSAEFEIARPDWRLGLAAILNDLKAAD